MPGEERAAIAARLARAPRAAWIAASAGWAACIFALSARTVEGRGDPSVFLRLLWNGAHAPFFAVLASLLVAALARRGAGRLVAGARTVGGAILLSGLYGLFDEWHQSFVPGRHASLLDAATDLFGAAFGALCVAEGLSSGSRGRGRVLAALGCGAAAIVFAVIGAA